MKAREPATQGVAGRTCLFCYTPPVLAPVCWLREELAAVPQGQAAAPLELKRALHVRLRTRGAQGIVGMAMAGIDMAAWDALARAAGQPRQARGVQRCSTSRPVPAAAAWAASATTPSWTCDCNEALSVPEAERRVRALAAEGLSWMEAPCAEPFSRTTTRPAPDR